MGLVTAFVLPTLGYVSGTRGAVAPLSFSLPLGACLFGIGMQLANGCGSGTLFSLGGGSGRMIIVLPFFVTGSLTGSFMVPAALELGGYDAVIIGGDMGNVARTVFNLVIVGAVAAAIYILGRYKGVRISISNGLTVGTIVIAILCWLCVVISGHPWGVTFGFTLWGAKIWQSLGGELGGFAFWSWPGPARAPWRTGPMTGRSRSGYLGCLPCCLQCTQSGDHDRSGKDNWTALGDNNRVLVLARQTTVGGL